MTPEQRFADYMAAFNRGDEAALRHYYADDVRLVIGNGRELLGPKAIIDFYRGVKAKTQRTIEIVQCFTDGEWLAAELESEFLAIADAPDFASGPMRRGDRLYINSFVLYESRDDRYARIRAAVFKREWRRAQSP